jgi:hypothetical protein
LPIQITTDGVGGILEKKLRERPQETLTTSGAKYLSFALFPARLTDYHIRSSLLTLGSILGTPPNRLATEPEYAGCREGRRKEDQPAVADQSLDSILMGPQADGIA